MSTIIQREATVTPDGTIEIAVPELQPGQRVSITIEPEGATDGPKLRAIDVINSMPGHLEFATAEEVGAYLEEERDSWDR